MFEFYNGLKNKELLIALYFLLFFLGFTTGLSYSTYNEFRVYETIALLAFGFYAFFAKQLAVTRVELLFLSFLSLGSFFWQQPFFSITELLLYYLLYKSFQVLNYNNSITKVIVLSTFLLFLLFPLSLFEYVQTGVYKAIWYPLPFNIRAYDSYFLIVSILATWLYLTESKYKSSYLVLLFLAFFAILLDGGRSATLAYNAFVGFVIIFNKSSRPPLIFTYAMSWLAYIAITYTASLGSSSLRIARESSNGRIDLWIDALQCWSQHPIVGCGFYQLDSSPNLSAHPHNIFIQVLTELGLVGFSFLTLIVFTIAKNLSWNLKKNHFVIAAFLAVGIDLSLSGIHIYPVTQIALLWLFTFLLKNPEFSHAQYFVNRTTTTSQLQRTISYIVFMVLAIWLIYVSFQASSFSSDMPLTPPRFWAYGYRLL
ncbi:O-antigen ligase family protein [Psychrobacter sp. NG27]|uniref:O-antigen ligase family protein n=1 Tax=Psychrobacter sp. NG27 TaxID=2781966 RepID=UPI0018E03EC5|nr:O-antigen ligase family protein [Psychrobacter sp. NG27]MBI0426021.1 O-antigen ligase family protein [Psychrobacter sp. NG27]